MIFRKIQHILQNGNKLWKDDRILGLTEGQVKQIRELRHHPAWEIYADLLDNLVIMKGEGLLRPDFQHVDFQRGFIAGVRAAAGTVDLAIATMENNDVRRTERAERQRDQPADTRRERSLYATPGWTGSQRRTGVGTG